VKILFPRGYLILALGVVFCVTGLGAGGEHAATSVREIVLSGPPGGLVTLPLLRMVETDALSTAGIALRFIPWKNPDQLRALIAGGQIHAAGLPTNVAANFRSRGRDIRLLQVSVWSVLWVISTSSQVNSLEDLRGSDILVPFRGDMPEILLRQAFASAGMTPGRDVSFRYVSSSIDAARLMMLGRAHNALIAEPSVSIALSLSARQSRDSAASPVTLYRAVDVQAAWAQSRTARPRIPMAGLAVQSLSESDEILLSRAFAEAVDWCRFCPVEASELMSRYFPSFDREAVALSLEASLIGAESARSVRGELEAFFTAILSDDPEKIGGRLPDDAFYGGAGP